MKAGPRVADDVLALIGCALRMQSEHSLLHLAILGLQFPEGGEQRLEVLGGKSVRDGCGWRRSLLHLLAVVRVRGRIHVNRCGAAVVSSTCTSVVSLSESEVRVGDRAVESHCKDLGIGVRFSIGSFGE